MCFFPLVGTEPPAARAGLLALAALPRSAQALGNPGGEGRGQIQDPPLQDSIREPWGSQAALKCKLAPPRFPEEAEVLRNAECHMAQSRTQQLLTVGRGIRSREVGGHSVSLVSGPPGWEQLAPTRSLPA